MARCGKEPNPDQEAKGSGEGGGGHAGLRGAGRSGKASGSGAPLTSLGPTAGAQLQMEESVSRVGGLSGGPGGRSRPAGTGTPAQGRRGTPPMQHASGGSVRRHGRGPRSPCLVPSENRGAREGPSSGHLGSGRSFPLRARHRPSSCRMGGSFQGSPGTRLVHQMLTQT